jgi:hypothetical protein
MMGDKTIVKIDRITDGPESHLDGAPLPTVRIEVRTQTGPETVELTIEAAIELWDAIGRYMEARVGI